MPARHTVVCDAGHKREIVVPTGKTVDELVCKDCFGKVEIVWEASASEYQVKLGVIDWL